MDPGDRAGRFRFLVRDRDTKFTAALDQVFTGNGTRVIKTPIHSPRANAFAERFAGTLRRECLDRLLIFGDQHLRKVLAQYAGALQRPPAASGAAPNTAAAQARPARRHHRQDQAGTSRWRPDQRIPESSLATTETPAQRP
jgi:integrase-like protein